jgi:hypothetical protein
LSRVVTAFLLSLVAGAAPAQSAQRLTAESAVAKLDAHLRAHAVELLQRFGGTFYVLGVSMDSSGALLGHAARQWPALEASPDAWTDSLVVELVDQRAGKRAVAYLTDRWRSVDPVRADSLVAVFHFESANGSCVETRYAYAFLDDGRVQWGEPQPVQCQRRVWTDSTRARPNGRGGSIGIGVRNCRRARRPGIAAELLPSRRRIGHTHGARQGSRRHLAPGASDL